MASPAGGFSRARSPRVAPLGVMPGVFDSIAAAATPIGPTDRVLVTVFLNGGNDHLNTLIPAESGAYQAARGSLAVAVDGSTAVGGGLHLHPNLSRLKTRFDSGQVALIRGAGEATNDHSHFTSTATWFAGVQGQPNPTGWLGRYADGIGLDGVGMVSIGWGGVPMLLRGNSASAVGLPPNGSLFGADRSENWGAFRDRSRQRLWHRRYWRSVRRRGRHLVSRRSRHRIADSAGLRRGAIRGGSRPRARVGRAGDQPRSRHPYRQRLARGLRQSRQSAARSRRFDGRTRRRHRRVLREPLTDVRRADSDDGVLRIRPPSRRQRLIRHRSRHRWSDDVHQPPAPPGDCTVSSHRSPTSTVEVT